MPVTVPFSKSTVFKICRQKMCRFRVNGRPIRRIFHRFQNVPASCERSLILQKRQLSKEKLNRPFSYSRKESESNDVTMQFEEFSNVHNSDRTSNATRSNLAYKIV